MEDLFDKTRAKIEGHNNIVIQDIAHSNIAIINVTPLKEQFNKVKEILTKLIPFEEALKMLLEFRETSGKIKKDKNEISTKNRPSLIYGFLINVNIDFGEGENIFQSYKFDSEKYLKEIIGFEENYLEKFFEENPDLNLLKNQEKKKENTVDIESAKILNKNDKNSESEVKNKKEELSGNSKIQNSFEEYKKKVEQEIEYIKSKIQIRISHLSSIFIQTIYSLKHQCDLLENMLTRIGHKEFNEEAKMHIEVVKELSTDFKNTIDRENMTKADFDILTPHAIGIIGIMIDLEKRRIIVERIVALDKKRMFLTTFTVISYIIIVIFTILLLVINNLFEMFIPPVKSNNIFSATIVWSLIGSFASMVHRFNKNPIHDFGSAVKWLITRPVQGLALGAALYLVMLAGEYFFSGNIAEPVQLAKAERILLLLAFLVGFSDKVGENIFNTLIKKYGSETDEVQKDQMGRVQNANS